MAERDDLQQAGQTLASIADRLSATFARELARVLSAAERSMVPLLRDAIEGSRTARAVVGRALTLRTELRAALTRAGYDALVQQASLDVVAQMADAYRLSGLSAHGSRLGRLTPARLEAFARLFAEDLLEAGNTAAVALWRSSMHAVYTQRPTEAIVATLAETLGVSIRRAQTLFDTQVSVVGREIEWVLTQDNAEQAYLYVGPLDARTRDWCLDHAGLVKTRDRIEALDNGQLANAFITGGGYNCRHSWLAVSDPALVAIVNTDQRAPGYDGRVQMARTIQDQRRLRRAA